MKLILPAALFFPVLVSAQPSKGCWEVFVSQGRRTPTDILASLYNSERTFVEIHKYPVYIAGFKYYFSKTLAAGITVAQHSFAHSYNNIYGGYHHSENYDAVSICPELKVVYYQMRFLQTYGAVATGAFLVKGSRMDSFYMNPKPSRFQSLNGTTLAFHITPLGIKAGGKLSAFAEVGIGFRGLYNMGVTYTWGKNMNQGN